MVKAQVPWALHGGEAERFQGSLHDPKLTQFSQGPVSDIGLRKNPGLVQQSNLLARTFGASCIILYNIRLHIVLDAATTFLEDNSRKSQMPNPNKQRQPLESNPLNLPVRPKILSNNSLIDDTKDSHHRLLLLNT